MVISPVFLHLTSIYWIHVCWHFSKKWGTRSEQGRENFFPPWDWSLLYLVCITFLILSPTRQVVSFPVYRLGNHGLPGDWSRIPPRALSDSKAPASDCYSRNCKLAAREHIRIVTYTLFCFVFWFWNNYQLLKTKRLQVIFVKFQLFLENQAFWQH